MFRYESMVSSLKNLEGRRPRRPLANLLPCIMGALLLPAIVQAAVTVSGTSFDYSENFDSLPFPSGDQFVQATGTDDWVNNGTIPCWTRALSNAKTDKDFYGVPNGSAGNFPRFANAGNANSSERSIGAMAANDVSVAFGIVFQVDSGYEVTDVAIAYRGEQWYRNATNTPKDSLQFEYKILNSYDAASFDIYAETGWAAVSTLDFEVLAEGGVSSRNGNSSGNFVSVPSSGQISINFATSVAAGEFIVFRWRADAPADGERAAGLFVDDFNASFSANATTPQGPPVNITSGPNFIIIVPDDHRWDATSYMQERIVSDFNRVARFPYFNDNDEPHTPNMDTLAAEGLYFDNGFVTYSLCSPSRATMLTGVQPFVHGITANDDEFPVDNATYATLMRDAGWATGYFGKWHMGTQTERPGFDYVRTYYGQGAYFGAEFRDGNGTLLQTTGARDPGGNDYDNWIDKVSTDYLLEFIDSKYASDERFLAFLGFKTPHDPRLTDRISNAPSSSTPAQDFSSLFSGDSHLAVPNLLSENGSAPDWKPTANQNSGGNNTTAYMQLVAAIDAQIGRVLNKLDELGLAEDTVVIYISDNGYFRGEHGLGDKRAAYEESLRVPFMIRYPAIQPSGAGLTPTEKIGLNLDIAPTILDLAGLQVPEHMQGRSLKPLLQGTTPTDWRDSFVFSYTEDPAYAATDPADMVGIRTETGYKLVRYAEDSGWDELFYIDSTATDDEKYENTNHIANAGFASILTELQTDMHSRLAEVGLLEVLEIRTDGLPIQADIIAGDHYPFVVEKSSDLVNWTVTADYEGSASQSTIDFTGGEPTSWDIIVAGNAADYAISANGGSPSVVQLNDTQLRLGAKKESGFNDGRDAVLIFELPVLPANAELTMAQLELVATRQYAQFDADLWVIGIQGSTSPIIDYHETQPQGGTKLQDRLMDHMLAGIPTQTTVKSSLAGELSSYLRNFYASNPGYAGGQYLFLRVNAAIDPRDQTLQGNDDRNFRIQSGNDGANAPKLKLSIQNPATEAKEFYRLRYGKTSAL